MEPLADYAERLKHLPLDLKAEVVLADMLEDGISLDDLILNPVGAFKRALGRDISDTEWVESQHRSQRWLQINLNRNGLYDLLPEGVFHQPTANDTSSSKESILLEMQIQREREQASRRFFLPIEQEFLRHRIWLEQEQRTYPFNTDTLQSTDLLGWFWDLPDFLTPIQTKRLLYLLPIMHRIAGDLIAMAACFEQVVEERVSLTRESPGREFVQVDTAPLGQWKLGDTSVFDGWLNDDEPQLRITVHIERSDRVESYLTGKNGRQLIEWLVGYLVPLDTAVHINLDTSTLSDTFLFTSDNSFGRLDFTTQL